MQCRINRHFGKGTTSSFRPSQSSKEVDDNFAKMCAERAKQDKMWDQQEDEQAENADKIPLIAKNTNNTNNTNNINNTNTYIIKK